MTRLETRVARAELALGTLSAVLGMVGFAAVYAYAGRGGPAAALWLFGSTLLLSVGVAAVAAGLVLRRGGQGRWSGQLLLLALPTVGLALLDWALA